MNKKKPIFLKIIEEYKQNKNNSNANISKCDGKEANIIYLRKTELRRGVGVIE